MLIRAIYLLLPSTTHKHTAFAELLKERNYQKKKQRKARDVVFYASILWRIRHTGEAKKKERELGNSIISEEMWERWVEFI